MSLGKMVAMYRQHLAILSFAGILTIYRHQLAAVVERLHWIHDRGGFLHAIFGWLPIISGWRRGPENWAQYDKEDVQKAPIIFVGSSIMREWWEHGSQKEHLAPLPIMNRAFGGSRTWEWLPSKKFGDVPAKIAAYSPRIVVYHCGSNDTNWLFRTGFQGEHIGAKIIGFATSFLDSMQELVPKVQIVVLSVIRAPQKIKEGSAAVIDEVNAGLASYCSRQPSRRHYVDLHPVLVNADGTPKLELYKQDNLHYKPECYTLFRDVLKPVLERVHGSPDQNF